jgi:hypothetical protein
MKRETKNTTSEPFMGTLLGRKEKLNSVSCKHCKIEIGVELYRVASARSCEGIYRQHYSECDFNPANIKRERYRKCVVDSSGLETMSLLVNELHATVGKAKKNALDDRQYPLFARHFRDAVKAIDKLKEVTDREIDLR